jgi:hypothetical protein
VKTWFRYHFASVPQLVKGNTRGFV